MTEDCKNCGTPLNDHPEPCITVLKSKLDSIERQAGDATEYVLAQINQRLLDQSMRWKQAAEEASARADGYRKELEGQDGPYYAELRTALARLQERLTGWENQAQVEARLRLKAESRLDTLTRENADLVAAMSRHANRVLERQRDDALSRLGEAAEMIADAIANHEGGSKCPLDLSSASVWLAYHDNAVERRAPNCAPCGGTGSAATSEDTEEPCDYCGGTGESKP